MAALNLYGMRNLVISDKGKTNRENFDDLDIFLLSYVCKRGFSNIKTIVTRSKIMVTISETCQVFTQVLITTSKTGYKRPLSKRPKVESFVTLSNAYNSVVTMCLSELPWSSDLPINIFTHIRMVIIILVTIYNNLLRRHDHASRDVQLKHSNLLLPLENSLSSLQSVLLQWQVISIIFRSGIVQFFFLHFFE